MIQFIAATQRVAHGFLSRLQARDRRERGPVGPRLWLAPRIAVIPKSKTQDLFVLGVLCVSVVNLLGCQTERTSTSDGWRMPPQPRSAPTPPPSLKADRMVFTVGSKPEDTNNNGFPDMIRVSIALFSSQHPTALRQSGAFVFTLHRKGQAGSPGETPMVEWRLEGDAVKQAESQMLAGPCYIFQLSLLDRGTDRLPLEQADLVCEFIPADGSPTVTSEGVRTIQIGRRGSTQ